MPAVHIVLFHFTFLLCCRRFEFLCIRMYRDTIVSCWNIDGESSCLESEFRRAMVYCYDGACTDAVFVASAANCETYAACDGTTLFQACTCCDGSATNCDAAASCKDDPIGFCSSTFLGRTCAEWGNPVCLPYAISKFVNHGDVRNEFFVCTPKKQLIMTCSIVSVLLFQLLPAFPK